MNAFLAPRFLAALALVLSAAAPLPCRAQPPPASTLSPREVDAHFLNASAVAALAGVKAGWMATQKASRGDLKEFGKKLMDDDGTIRGQLKALIGMRGAIPPGETDAETTRELAVLQQLDGAEFDRQFSSWAVKSRRGIIREFESASANASDPEVKTFAQKFLPILKDHLAKAESLQRTG